MLPVRDLALSVWRVVRSEEGGASNPASSQGCPPSVSWVRTTVRGGSSNPCLLRGVPPSARPSIPRGGMGGWCGGVFFICMRALWPYQRTGVTGRERGYMSGYFGVYVTGYNGVYI